MATIDRNTPLREVTQKVAEKIAELKKTKSTVDWEFKSLIDGIYVRIGGHSAEARGTWLQRAIIWAVFVPALGNFVYQFLSTAFGWSLGAPKWLLVATFLLIPASLIIKAMVATVNNRWNSGIHQALKDAQGAKEFEEISVYIICVLWTLRNLPLLGSKQSWLVAIFDWTEWRGGKPNANSSLWSEDKLIAGLNDLLEGKFATPGTDLNSYVKNVMIENRISSIAGLFGPIKPDATGFARAWLRSILVPIIFANWGTNKLILVGAVVAGLIALSIFTGGFAR